MGCGAGALIKNQEPELWPER